jgi:hypothetical protein
VLILKRSEEGVAASNRATGRLFAGPRWLAGVVVGGSLCLLLKLSAQQAHARRTLLFRIYLKKKRLALRIYKTYNILIINKILIEASYF